MLLAVKAILLSKIKVAIPSMALAIPDTRAISFQITAVAPLNCLQNAKAVQKSVRATLCKTVLALTQLQYLTCSFQIVAFLNQ